jgi:predicted PurR-regulated permease PerM
MEIREQSISISIGTIIKAIVVGLLFVTLFILKDLVLVLLVSIVVASSVEPGTQWFIRRKVPRLFAVILIYLLIAIAFACVVPESVSGEAMVAVRTPDKPFPTKMPLKVVEPVPP